LPWQNTTNLYLEMEMDGEEFEDGEEETDMEDDKIEGVSHHEHKMHASNREAVPMEVAIAIPATCRRFGCSKYMFSSYFFSSPPVLQSFPILL
jgi:hypothetical protein